jgi:hypothetical protein
MLFVFCHEVVTAAHRHGQRTGASCAPAAGFVAMMELDPALAKRWRKTIRAARTCCSTSRRKS